MKIGVAISHPTIPYDEAFFRAVGDAGIDVIEVTRYAEEYPSLDYKTIGKLARAYGIGLWSFHLPFYAGSTGMVVNISAGEKDVLDKTMELYSDIIAKATDIGIDKFVVHPINYFIREEDAEGHLERSREALSRLAGIAERYGATIAVENLIPGLIGKTICEMERLISADDRLRICFDTNHLLTAKHTEFIDKFRDRIITLHVSDFDFVSEKHWLPGEGDIDWVELKGALDRIGYSGPWMYEVNPITPDTIVRERALEYKDFVEVSHCIFEGKAPTPFGQRK